MPGVCGFERLLVMPYKPRIKLIIATSDSHSVSEAIGENATDAMYDAAWDLVYTLMTGKRRAPKPRYKKYREKKEREAAARKPKKKPSSKSKKKNPILDAVGQMGADAISKELGRSSKTSRLVKRGTGNHDPIGLHSMVENNREDDQT